MFSLTRKWPELSVRMSSLDMNSMGPSSSDSIDAVEPAGVDGFADSHYEGADAGVGVGEGREVRWACAVGRDEGRSFQPD